VRGATAAPRGAFASAIPLAGTRVATSRSRGALRRGRRARVGRIEARSRALRLGSPRSPRTAHLHVARASVREGGPFRTDDARARCSTLAGRASRGLPSSIDPRRSTRSQGDRGAFGHRALRAFVRITPHVRPRGPPVHATRALFNEVERRAFATRSASAFVTAPECPA